MIAAILPERCIGCGDCVRACPTLVLAPGEPLPMVTRLDACQTCYLCELACEQDAIWVNPDQASGSAPPATDLIASGQLGQIRRDHGWNEPLDAGQLDDYRLLGPLLRAGSEIATARYKADQAARSPVST